MTSRDRYGELDALRGLAALSVVFHHALIVFPVFYASVVAAKWDGSIQSGLANTPLHAAWAGTQAVMLFFVLSGFVLSLAFLGESRRPTTYRAFIIRRFFRLYLPLYVSVAIALTARGILGRHFDGTSQWLRAIWHPNLSVSTVIDHILLVPWFDDNATDPVLWSLIHEMRVSLIFPFLMLAVVAWSWQRCLAGAALISLAAFLGIQVVTDSQHLLTSVEYVLLFVVGALLAKHRHGLVAAVNRLTLGQQALGLVVALCLYTSDSLGAPFIAGHKLDWGYLVLITVACAYFVLVALADSPIRAALRSRPLMALGRSSYSLYLLHAVVIATAVHAFNGKIALPVVVTLAVVVSIPLALLMHRLVEVPSIRWGRELSGRPSLHAAGAVQRH